MMQVEMVPSHPLPVLLVQIPFRSFLINMISFIRFAGAVVVLVSLGLMVNAIPIERIHLTAATGADLVSRLCAKLILEDKLEAKLKALLLCKNIEDLRIQIAVVVALLRGCADQLSKIGAGIVVDADANASLVTCIISIITLVVQVFATLSLKFGTSVCAEIDEVLRFFLATLGTCMNGVIGRVAKTLAEGTVGVMGQIQLKLCLRILGLAA
ncbi:unnamed protein product [Rhizoctonia solani]|uniref:Uncharacterized protein n=1 Tax=Rhizoctonia solani TaxID=456999 RepID=A0A8H3GIZ1_9AGAM|nr:unnamed protein product [Rhizoctonia solani]